VWEPFPHISVVGIAATLIGGYPIFKEAFENIIERKMTMELSMTIALLSALAIGEFFTALVITGFVLAAEVLEGLTVGRGRRAIQDLLDFLPRTVSVRLVVDSIGVGMAAFGFLNPLLAAFIHVTSELAFILNSTRRLPRSSESRQ
jgi:cation transport ATPase